MRDKKKRAARDHERYMEKREEILAYQKRYREAHKDEIRERRRARSYEQRYVNGKSRVVKTKSELAHESYMRHREERCAKSRERYRKLKQRNYERGEEQQYAGVIIT